MSTNSSTNGSELLRNADQIRDVEKAQIVGSATTGSEFKDTDQNIVDWDGPNDPENPQNW